MKCGTEPPVQTHVPALVWPHWAVFQISVPHHTYLVPPHPVQNLFPATLHSGNWALCFSLQCLAFASDLLLTSSTNVLHCHAIPAVPSHASGIFAFHMSQFPLSLRLCVLLPSITCKVNAIAQHTLTPYPLLSSFVYLAYICCMYNRNMLNLISFFFSFFPLSGM